MVQVGSKTSARRSSTPPVSAFEEVIDAVALLVFVSGFRQGGHQLTVALGWAA